MQLEGVKLMEMTDMEIVMEYNLAKNKLQQIEILADQNQVRKQVIVDILRNNGVEDLPSQYMKLPGAKSDKGKLALHFVPPQIVKEIARVREYGNAKYADPENWRSVELEKFHDALLRHILAAWNDPSAVDPESGLPHLSHAACNLAFILEDLYGEGKK